MNDLINRQAAIDVWKADFKGFVDLLDMPRDDYKGIMEYIDEVPSAQLQRIRAKWIYGDGCCKCSACGEDPIEFVETTGFDAALMNEENPMKFCPNCGADMRGEFNEV